MSFSSTSEKWQLDCEFRTKVLAWIALCAGQTPDHIAEVPLCAPAPTAVTYAVALGRWLLDPSAEEERFRDDQHLSFTVG